MRLIFVVVFSLLAWVQAATADQARVAQLFDALNMDEIISIMQDEGKLDAVATIEIYAERAVDDEVKAQIDRIFDKTEMRVVLTNLTSENMNDAQIAAATEFLNSDVGMRANTLETTARRAISDDVIEEYALSQFDDASELPRYKQFQDLITTLDLIDQNTYGAMGAQYVFMRQLTGTDALGLTDDAITELLMASEEELRAGIAEWLYGFFNMAYAPLVMRIWQPISPFKNRMRGRRLTDPYLRALTNSACGMPKKWGRWSRNCCKYGIYKPQPC
jgi:hypothetical protein